METIGLFGGVLLFSVLCLLPEVRTAVIRHYAPGPHLSKASLAALTAMSTSSFPLSGTLQ